MYDSLIDHFSCQHSKPEKAYHKYDVEAGMSKLSSNSTLVDATEITEQSWKLTRTELGIMITLAVCSLV